MDLRQYKKECFGKNKHYGYYEALLSKRYSDAYEIGQDFFDLAVTIRTTARSSRDPTFEREKDWFEWFLSEVLGYFIDDRDFKFEVIDLSVVLKKKSFPIWQVIILFHLIINMFQEMI